MTRLLQVQRAMLPMAGVMVATVSLAVMTAGCEKTDYSDTNGAAASNGSAAATQQAKADSKLRYTVPPPYIHKNAKSLSDVVADLKAHGQIK